MNVKPLADRVVVKPLDEQEMIKGGIIIPDTAKEKPMEGEVVEIGTGRVTEDGKKVEMETRAFEDTTEETLSMRSKEQAADYRFIPEPDLPIINISKQQVDKIKSTLPELPQTKVQRFIKQYKLSGYTADVLTANLDIANFFEQVHNKVKDIKFVSNWVTVELLRVLNWNKKSLSEVEIKPEHFIELIKLIKQGKLTELAAKKILNDFIPKSFDPSKKLKDLGKVSGNKEIEDWCKQAIKQNSKAVEDYIKIAQKEGYSKGRPSHSGV